MRPDLRAEYTTIKRHQYPTLLARLFEVLKMTTVTLEGAHQMIAVSRELEPLRIVRRQIHCS